MNINNKYIIIKNKISNYFLRFKAISLYTKIGYCLSVILIYILLNFCFNLLFGTLSKSWPKTQGVIVSSECKAGGGLGVGHTDFGSFPVYGGGAYNEIIYEYSINNKTYRSSRVSYPHTVNWGSVGKIVTVYYWKIFPSFSVLETGYYFHPVIIILFIGFLFFGFMLLFITDKGPKKNKTRGV